jgi:pimeloyl-ACP methyl ester carboxylesterase
MKNGAQTIYNDLPASEASLWESRMIAQSYAVQRTEMTRAAYKYIPSTYLICENDQAAPARYQEMFAKMANSHVERCDSGHSPMLSQTETLVQKIIEAVEKALEKEKV